ncbi:MarR family winged helix-turn-helix transcriptional regulator [Lelliottia sp. JS-SCA-14]|uniref:MarR family winged helix-turn-helix transcriptional regulator n=1 Tax=Lelliottia sp. JS-SCA-14 TaxID=3110110 RepID=UPI002D798C97|nr:MarR family transcriptional regulator [Lelliottia sp. JS-SCA-14]
MTRCNRYCNTPDATSQYLGLTKGTVTQSLNKLESEGLLTKKNDGRDKRIVHLVLTPKARKVMHETMTKEWNTQPFSEEQLKTDFLAHLRETQKNQGAILFGECRFCRFHQQ